MMDEDAQLVEALERARLARALQHQAKIDEMVAIASAADLCGITGEELDEALLDQVVGERMIRSGAEGTPFISEFLALELGPVLQCSPEAAFDQIATVMNVKHRHPVLWQAFVSGQIGWNHAARVAAECRELSLEAAAEVDRKCAHSLAQWPVSRVMYHLKAWIMAADPARAARKKILAEAHHYVDIDTFNAAACHFSGRISAADGAALDHALEEIAKALPTQQPPTGLSLDELSDYERRHFDHNMRRSLAMGILARRIAGQDQLPHAELIIRINGDDPALFSPDGSLSTSGAAQVDKWGELLTSVLPEFLAGSKVTVRPVLVPSEVPPANQHDPSGLMRLAVGERNPVDIYPFGTRRSASCQLDHTIAFQPNGPPGQTHPEIGRASCRERV